MAQEDPNRLAEWVLILRQQARTLHQHFMEWVAVVREEPALFWQTTSVRYTVYCLSGVFAVIFITQTVAFITPAPPVDAKPRAKTADFHVVCSDPDCEKHFVIHKRFNFSGFPVDCQNCGGETGFRARKCNSDKCRGRWIAPQERDDRHFCPRCGAAFD